MSLFWYPRHQLMISPKKRRDQDGGDPKTMARKPKPHYRYMFSFYLSCWWLFKQMSSQSFRSFFFFTCLCFLSTRSRAASRPSPLVSTPQTQTSPPRRQTPRKSVLNLQTHLQMCPVYRRTSAGWPTTVSPPFFFLNRKSLFKCLFYVQWQHCCFSPVLLASPRHAKINF